MKALIPARLLLAFAALGASACAVGPKYVKPEPAAPAQWTRAEPSGQPATTAAAPGDLSRWWERLDDPLLSQLEAEAVQASPDLRSARARVREARARAAVANAGLFPTLDATGRASRTRTRSPTREGVNFTRNLFSVGFDASWELDVFGGVRRGIEAANADFEASVASLQNARVSLLAEVALNYVQLRSLQRRLAIARDNLATQTETLQLTDWREQAGLVSSQDVEQARSAVEQTKAQLPSLELSIAQTEHTLDVLLGKPPGTLHARLATQGQLPAVPSELAVGIPADTLRQRPDVSAAERKLAAETARVGVAEAARYPSINLSGSIGLDALNVSALGQGSSLVYSLLGSLIAPLFQGGKLRAQVEAQDAVREQAQIAYEQSILTALQDVENALVSLARNRERADALTRAVDAARNAALLARERYSAGLIDFQSVLDTERNVLVAEESLAVTQADSVVALIQLYKALGGGWSPSSKEPP